MRKLLALFCVLFCLCACSTMQVKSDYTFSMLPLQNQNFQIKVRTGNPTMDKVTYELAFLELSPYFPVSEKEPFTGTIEIIFLSGSASGSAVTPGPLSNKNCTMIFCIRDLENRRMWTAGYNYKGEWELSGFSINTPDEAARLCLKRIVEELQKSLRVHTKTT